MRPDFGEGGIGFGLGLIGIGKPWGHVPGPVPDENAARALLDFAFENGVRYFDTAASYGCSERRLGAFLRSLAPAGRACVTVATKFGEHWDDRSGAPFADHSYDALARSLERSVEALGAIDVLQLHKTTPEMLRSDALARAWELARGFGIGVLGPSVSDPESARLACAGGYAMMQLPVNRASPQFAPAIEEARRAGLWIAANRPFEMGRLMADAGADRHQRRVEAFRYVMSVLPRGVVLSGTTSRDHLRENLAAFREALTCPLR